MRRNCLHRVHWPWLVTKAHGQRILAGPTLQTQKAWPTAFSVLLERCERVCSWSSARGTVISARNMTALSRPWFAGGVASEAMERVVPSFFPNFIPASSHPSNPLDTSEPQARTVNLLRPSGDSIHHGRRWHSSVLTTVHGQHQPPESPLLRAALQRLHLQIELTTPCLLQR